MATFTSRNSVVALGSLAFGSAVFTILPCVLSSFRQAGSSLGGRSTFSREPVTLPQTMTSSLWVPFSEIKLASAYRGTHCNGVGSLSWYDLAKQFLYGTRTAETGAMASESRESEVKSVRGRSGVLALRRCRDLKCVCVRGCCKLQPLLADFDLDREPSEHGLPF